MSLKDRVHYELEVVARLMEYLTNRLAELDARRALRPTFRDDRAEVEKAQAADYLREEYEKARRFAYCKLIRYTDAETGETKELRVTPAGAGVPELGIVGRNAPILERLISRRIGDTADIRTPKGVQVVRVDEVSFLERHAPLVGHHDDFSKLRWMADSDDEQVVRHLREAAQRLGGLLRGAGAPVPGTAAAQPALAPTAPTLPTTVPAESPATPSAPSLDVEVEVLTQGAGEVGAVPTDSSLSDAFFMAPTQAQEDAMRLDSVGLIVVTGVAGSGKTSVALGRMAMLCMPGHNGERAEFDAFDGLGVVLNESLVGYLRRTLEGQLQLSRMPVRSYTRVRQELATRREILPKTDRRAPAGSPTRVRRWKAGTSVDGVIGSRAWYAAVAPTMVVAIYRAFLAGIGEFPEGWTPGVKAETDLQGPGAVERIAEPPTPPAGELMNEVGFAQRRAIVPIWKGLRDRVDALLTNAIAGRGPAAELRELVRRLDEVRRHLADELEANEAWSSPKFKLARKAMRDEVKAAFERSLRFAERYLEIVGDAAVLAQMLNKAEAPPGSQEVASLRGRAAARMLSDSDIDCLVLLAEQACAGYVGRDGAEPIEWLREGARYSHLFVDEFQDFTEVQLALIQELAEPRKHAVIAVGDYQQRLNAAGVSRRLPNVSNELFLAENKRQTAPLHALSAAFRTEVQGETEPLLGARPRPSDELPFVISRDDGALADALLAKIVDARDAGFSVAVICPTPDRASQLYAALRDDLEAENALCRLSANADASQLCETTFVHFTTPGPVKGLEFHAAFVVDLNDYDLDDAVERDRLYVALTRPRQRLGLAWSGSLSPELHRVLEGKVA